MRTLPAAAIGKGDTVRIADEDVTIAKVHNSTPVNGRITWDLKGGGTHEIGAAIRVEVVKL